MRKYWWCIFIVLIIIGISAYFKFYENKPDDEKITITAVNIDNTLVQRAKKFVSRNLKDPDSAIFGVVFPSGDSSEIACGKVNAKNSYGGYTGEKRFIAIPSQGGVSFEGDEEFDSQWNKLCGSSAPKILLN